MQKKASEYFLQKDTAPDYNILSKWLTELKQKQSEYLQRLNDTSANDFLTLYKEMQITNRGFSTQTRTDMVEFYSKCGRSEYDLAISTNTRTDAVEFYSKSGRYEGAVTIAQYLHQLEPMRLDSIKKANDFVSLYNSALRLQKSLHIMINGTEPIYKSNAELFKDITDSKKKYSDANKQSYNPVQAINTIYVASIDTNVIYLTL